MQEKQKESPVDTKFLIHRVTIDFPVDYRPPEFKLTSISRVDDCQNWSDGPHEEFPLFVGKIIGKNCRIELRGENGQEMPNGSIQHVLQGFGRTTENALILRPAPRGQIRVFVYTIVDGAKTYLDADLAALREVLAYIQNYLHINISRSSCSSFVVTRPEQWVSAWILHGKKDQRTGLATFEPVKIKKDHPIFERENSEVQASWISLNLDFPIRCLKLKEEEGEAGNMWAGYAMETPFGIDTGTWDKEKRQAWSSRSLKTVLIAREDEKDFTVQHQEAFFGFCKAIHENAVLPPTLGRDLGTEIEIFMRRHLQPEVFERFFEGMKKEKGIFSEAWRASVSPYRKSKIITLRFRQPGALEAFADAP